MYNGFTGLLTMGGHNFDAEYQIDPITTTPNSYITVEMNSNFDSIWRTMKSGDTASLIGNGMNNIYELELTRKPDCLKYSNGKYATIYYKILGIKKI